jgi:metallo-beta-lactamase family protein
LWGETIQVKAQVHTIGGLSAHADQQGLMDWYHHFKKRPRVVLVHGEPEAMDTLAHRLKSEFHADVVQANFQQKLKI